MKEAAVGVASGQEGEIADVRSEVNRGLNPEEIAAYLLRNAEKLERAELPERSGVHPSEVARQTARTLRGLAEGMTAGARDSGSETQPRPRLRLEDLERRLSVMEEKLFAALLAATPDEEVVSVRAQADRELAPYRSKMNAPQIDQLQKQYIYKRLLEN